MKISISALIMTALCCAILSGCIIVIKEGSEPGSTQYLHGELQSAVDAPQGETVAAVKKAVQAMKFTPLSESSDTLSYMSVAQTAQEKKIRIKLNAITETTTMITIKVGSFGDKALSYRLLEEIHTQRANLPSE